MAQITFRDYNSYRKTIREDADLNMDKAFKMIWILFLSLNAAASFILLGMPKVYSNKAHFTALPIRTHYESIYSPLENVTIKDDEGKEHTITTEDRIGISSFDRINWEIEKTMGQADPTERFEPDENEVLSMSVENKSIYFKMTRKELNAGKFKDVTEQYQAECEAERVRKIEEGEKEYNQYMLNQKIWFLLPHKYIGNYLVGLTAAAFVVIVHRLISKENPMLSVILSLILIAFKSMGIVYFYLHPMVCH